MLNVWHDQLSQGKWRYPVWMTQRGGRSVCGGCGDKVVAVCAAAGKGKKQGAVAAFAAVDFDICDGNIDGALGVMPATARYGRQACRRQCVAAMLLVCREVCWLMWHLPSRSGGE